MEKKDLFAPLKNLQFIDRDLVKPNDYNPNKVLKKNLDLLTESILNNGFCFPIVNRVDESRFGHRANSRPPLQ